LPDIYLLPKEIPSMAHSHGAYQGGEVTCHHNSNLVRHTD